MVIEQPCTWIVCTQVITAHNCVLLCIVCRSDYTVHVTILIVCHLCRVTRVNECTLKTFSICLYTERTYDNRECLETYAVDNGETLLTNRHIVISYRLLSNLLLILRLLLNILLLWLLILRLLLNILLLWLLLNILLLWLLLNILLLWLLYVLLLNRLLVLWLLLILRLLVLLLNILLLNRLSDVLRLLLNNFLLRLSFFIRLTICTLLVSCTTTC